jgi:aminoglycoside phosphotransferase (APT) family kinase protein
MLDYDRDHPYQPSLVHGDLWYENVLFDAEQDRLVGVIDFENASIGDPALDLATQRYLGEPFAGAVFDAYYHPQPPPGDLSKRMALLIGLRELLGLEHGMMVSTVDPGSVAKVRAAIAAERYKEDPGPWRTT